MKLSVSHTKFLSLLFVICAMSSAGCNMCCPGYLDDYATVGGKWARSHPSEGRVGSAFSDPGTTTPTSSHSRVIGESSPVFSMGEEIQVIETPQPDDTIMLGDGW